LGGAALRLPRSAKDDNDFAWRRRPPPPRLAPKKRARTLRQSQGRLWGTALRDRTGHTDRRGKNAQLPFPDLLRQSIYSRLAGYEDLNDAERLSQDPTFREICDSASGK
jgi:hypothetical protein